MARHKRTGVDPNHEPATSAETANVDGMETDAAKVAERKNADGRTNPVDFEKNTGPGPGNPEERVIDPRDEQGDDVKTDAGKSLKTEETPKVINDTVTAEGPREITNNVIPDMEKRRNLVVQAKRYGITVNPDWSDDRLRGELQIALEGRADLQVLGAVPNRAMGKVDYDPATEKLKSGNDVA